MKRAAFSLSLVDMFLNALFAIVVLFLVSAQALHANGGDARNAVVITLERYPDLRLDVSDVEVNGLRADDPRLQKRGVRCDLFSEGVAPDRKTFLSVILPHTTIDWRVTLGTPSPNDNALAIRSTGGVDKRFSWKGSEPRSPAQITVTLYAGGTYKTSAPARRR